MIDESYMNKAYQNVVNIFKRFWLLFYSSEYSMRKGLEYEDSISSLI